MLENLKKQPIICKNRVGTIKRSNKNIIRKFKEKKMGRNKIKIERIESERKRTATYTKRSHGLIKKAMELSLLCDCEVSLFIFANDKLVVYSSKDVKDTLIKFVEFKSNYFSYSNTDYPAICHSTSIPDELSEQRAVGAAELSEPQAAPISAVPKDPQSVIQERVNSIPPKPVIPRSVMEQIQPQHPLSPQVPNDYYDQRDRMRQAPPYMYEQNGHVSDMVNDYGHSQPYPYYHPQYANPPPPPYSQTYYKSVVQEQKYNPMDKRNDMIDPMQQQIKKPPE